MKDSGLKRIAITTTSFGREDKSVLDRLDPKKFEIAMNPHGRKMEKTEVIELCKNCRGIIAGTEMIDKDVLEKLPGLKVISRCGVGMDNVDLEAAKRLGIEVFNTPDAPTVAVAELTVGLVLGLLRKITSSDVLVKRGKWEKLSGNLLRDKKIGIIGFGRIGKKVAELLKPFGCKIAYSDPVVQDKKKETPRLSIDELVRWADIISLHASAKDMILDERMIRSMKRGSWLINVSRGGLIDEKALCDTLRSGHIAGAALDVFEHEPYKGGLAGLDNVILTPHIGSYAKEARIDMEKEAVNNLLKGLGEEA